MTLTRRGVCLLAAAAFHTLPGFGAHAQAGGGREPHSYYGGFRLALQSACFGRLSLDQAIGAIVGLGIKYCEFSPVHADLASIETAALREIRRQFLDAGLSVHTYGVARFAKSDGRRLQKAFRRAQEFGFTTLLLEADPSLLKELDRLAQRCRVNAAIHNAYRDGRGDSPDAIWERIKERSPRCGLALDTANFLSAGYDPVAAIGKFQGRILTVRLGDVAQPGVRCALGRGKADVAAILKALREQDYDGILALDVEAAENADEAVSASLACLKKLTGGRYKLLQNLFGAPSGHDFSRAKRRTEGMGFST